ncbi:ABC transporter permease [Mucilaginibacter gynuensis]|uniref:ABC transporter permease n=1 Tax=Mucilaginibacter gynuensis TaxID=1302236 RepID=A0ABP8H6L0_9SPHI
MLRNYFTLAWRNLRKNKVFSFINIFGLSIGMAFVLVIGAYIWGELQVNAGVSDRVYIMQSKWKQPDMGLEFTSLAPLGKALKENYPNLITSYYRHDGLSTIISKGDKHFTEGIQNGTPSLLTMFGFKMLYGDAKTALSTPNSVVITENQAIKYFGRTDVVGQTLTINAFNGSKQDFAITGVLKNLPRNSVTNFGGSTNEIFMNEASFKFFGRDAALDAWNNPYMVNYIQLKPGVKPSDLDAAINQLARTNTTPDIQKNLKTYLVQVNDFYLQDNKGSARKMIYTLAFIAMFILLMAIINFINISIGNSVTRLKEIGVRKVMGSSRVQLIIQFLTESVLLSLFSFIIALLIYLVSRPFFSSVMGKDIPKITEFPLYFAVLPLLIVLLIGILAGMYPAFILSAQSSIDSLKGKLKTVKEKVVFRHSLIVVQFVTAIVVFIAALVINKQASFFFQSNLGYDKEQVITAKVPRDWSPEGVKHIETMRNEFAAMPQVADATVSFEIPNGQSGNASNNLYKASQDPSHGIMATSIIADEHYTGTYKIPLIAGQFFAAQGEGTDVTKLVINETAAKALGWQNPADALGQPVRVQNDPSPLTVGGVVKDFHFGSMHEKIQPILFYHVKRSPVFRYLSFKLRPGNMANNVATLQSKWSALFPNAPFEYVFLDDTIAKLYQQEMQIKKASQAATVIALLVVLLGVLSIATLSIARRVREVGIRKVLGASAMQVVWLFIKEFAILVLVANLIAWPVAWFSLNSWLTGYAYRINLDALPFLSVALILAALVAVVIAVKTIKTALDNPVKSLTP